ncbi:hypothetical protein B566_EDAN003726 [Ephemera danica]|nr:hypothetical protein B566_EDAN003726 [Ephemera danica]
MGRKIPARKHKGVKDPEKQNAARFARIKDKINLAPRDPDEQAIPKRLLELKQLIEKTKIRKPKVKKASRLHKHNELIDTSKFKEKEVLLPGMRRPEKPVPVFKQHPGEEPHQFVCRIQRKCQEVIHECTFEDKFNVNVQRNEETGDIEGVSKVPKEETAFLRDLQPTAKNQGKKSRLARNREKRKEKMQKKKQDKVERKTDDFSLYKDEFMFGETVHAPPQLNILPRKSKKEDDIKPGRRELLLKQMLPKSNQEQQPTSVLAKLATGKKKKKNALPAAEARIREAQRVEAVQAYRMMKARKHAAQNVS